MVRGNVTWTGLSYGQCCVAYFRVSDISTYNGAGIDSGRYLAHLIVLVLI